MKQHYIELHCSENTNIFWVNPKHIVYITDQGTERTLVNLTDDYFITVKETPEEIMRKIKGISFNDMGIQEGRRI